MEIQCESLNTTYYFCIECDKVTPFDGNAHCFICGCDCPLGELNDYSISEKEWENDYKMNYEKIGLVSKLSRSHWLHKYYSK
jgi:hypothetical protein